jgi:hypothetical protein
MGDKYERHGNKADSVQLYNVPFGGYVHVHQFTFVSFL